MSTIVALLIGSALMGLAIGLTQRVLLVLGLSAPGLAALAAIAVWDFGFIAAAAITFACLTISQITYIAGAWLTFKYRQSSDASMGKPLDDRSGENRQKGVAGDQNHQGNHPSYLAG
jgi:membrane protein implicated in regulation of membrane protease activity